MLPHIYVQNISSDFLSYIFLSVTFAILYQFICPECIFLCSQNPDIPFIGVASSYTLRQCDYK